MITYPVHRYSFTLILLLSSLLLVPTATSQVSVSLSRLTATPGEDVTMNINVSGLSAETGITSFGFQVVTSSPEIAFCTEDTDGSGDDQTCVDPRGTLVESGWTVLGNGDNGAVGGFAATPIAEDSGILLKIKFRLSDNFAGGTVTLNNFRFNAGDPENDPVTPTGNISLFVNNTPTVEDIATTTDEDTPVAITLLGQDADGDALVYTRVTAPTMGTVRINGNVATYTPTANANGTDTFTYRASDGEAMSDPATVTVTINAVNDAPVIENIEAGINEDNPLTITLTATDVENETITFGIGDTPDNGTAQLDGATLTYTPDADFEGTDTFTYTASDGTDTSTATITITVNPVNDAPVVAAIDTATEEDEALPIPLQGSDADGDMLTYSIVRAPDNGSVTIEGSVATYTPDPDFNGMDSFTYDASDGSVFSTAATVTIEVTPTGMAELQLLNNINESTLTAPDLYVGDVKLIDNLAMGTGLPFQTFADGELEIGIAPGNSSSSADVQATVSLTLQEDEAVVAILNGDLAGGLTITSLSGKQAADDGNDVELLFYHGIAGGPDVDLVVVSEDGSATPVRTLADDVSFDQATDYLIFPVEAFNLQVASDDGSFDEVFRVDISGRAGDAFVVWIQPGGVEVIDQFGRSTTSEVVTDVDDSDATLPEAFTLHGNYPNPFNPSTSVVFDLPQPAQVQLIVKDMLGRTVYTSRLEQRAAARQQRIDVDASTWASGMYLYQLTIQAASMEQSLSGSMILMK